MFAAEHFAASARTIEDSGPSANQEDLNRHRAYATAAVLSAVAFLESSINEFYHEAQNRDTNSLSPLKEKVLALLDQFWPELERSSVLHKYQVALLIADTQRFDQGGQPYQDADSLIKLRDALVHYKPEWDDEQGRHHSLQERLQHKFQENRLVPAGSLWFPHLCLGAGCANWAVSAAGRFSDEFCSRLGIPPRHWRVEGAA